MKKIMIIALLMCCAMIGFSQNEDAIAKYFDKYVDDEDFTVVYISGRMFSMFADVADEEDGEILEITKSIKGLRILTTEKNGKSLYDEAISKFQTSEYEELMKVRDEGEYVNFYIKEDGNAITELLLLVGGKDDDDFVLLSFIGDIDLSQISKLSSSTQINGLYHLEKIKDKKKKEQ